MAASVEYEIEESASGEFTVTQKLAAPAGTGSQGKVTLHREYPTRAEAQAAIDRLTESDQ
jgi:hypothetical protein